MTLPPRFLETLHQRVSLVSTVAKKVKLTRKGSDYWGCCPFHKEKTPSFSVSEEKGFYHCFGCGAHGDAISFVMQSENLPFPEALERLAHSVGMEVPKYEKTRPQQTSLYQLLEDACTFYQEQLFQPIGEQARKYLLKRGVPQELISQFRLGYAPHGNALKAFLLKKGYTEQDMIAAGVVGKATDASRENYDYFRDRVLFPIMNRKGQVIAFGGRIMAQGEPKYLNSPETELFHKGENLYALFQSLETIRQEKQMILVEGYMDVISLHAAGIHNVIAPLGTALTERQIELLWKYVEEPTICFDGDTAGRNAAYRACDRAFPILQEGRSLRFAWLPDGLDPDDFVKAFGAQELRKVLSETTSLSDLLWQRLLEKQKTDTPERLAQLEKQIKLLLSKMQNATVRAYYSRDLSQRLFALTKEQRAKQRTTRKPTSKTHVPNLHPYQNELKMLLAYLVLYPQISDEFLEPLAQLHIHDKKTTQYLQALCSEIVPEITTQDLQDRLRKQCPNLFTYLATQLDALKRSRKNEEKARQDMTEMLSVLQKGEIDAELHALMAEYAQTLDPALWKRICLLKQEKEKLQEDAD
ncbi:MAG: DNA primase [Alphaproteobacteria bacterium]|nr:DNA primase [Alphaproteobacteria bacterium]